MRGGWSEIWMLVIAVVTVATALVPTFRSRNRTMLWVAAVATVGLTIGQYYLVAYTGRGIFERAACVVFSDGPACQPGSTIGASEPNAAARGLGPQQSVPPAEVTPAPAELTAADIVGVWRGPGTYRGEATPSGAIGLNEDGTVNPIGAVRETWGYWTIMSNGKLYIELHQSEGDVRTLIFECSITDGILRGVSTNTGQVITMEMTRDAS